MGIKHRKYKYISYQVGEGCVVLILIEKAPLQLALEFVYAMKEELNVLYRLRDFLPYSG